MNKSITNDYELIRNFNFMYLLDYKYSSDSSVYFCPESMNCATIDNYLIFIDQLPVIEEPEVFGMHENANMAYQV